MTLSLLLPIGLTALAALLLPLLLHLARRSEQRVLVFAALRWLQAQPQPRRKRRFEEPLLLLVRLLLLVLLALLLAAPILMGQPDRTPRVLVAPGVDAMAARADDGLRTARWQWLAAGFPEAGDTGEAPPAAASPAVPAGLSSLLREMDATLPAGTPLTVLVPMLLDGADAERPLLSRAVDWRVVRGAATPANAPSARPAPAGRMPVLHVRYSPDRAPSVRYLRAASVAWHAPGANTADATSAAREATPVPGNIAPTSQALDADARALVWLAPGPLPGAVRAWISDGGSALLDVQSVLPELADAAVLWRDDDGPVVRGMRLGRGRVMRLERPLLPASMPGLLEADFPRQLQRLFVAAPPAPARVAARLHAPRVGAPAPAETPRPLAPWLAVLIAALFVLERWLANGPRRRATP